MDTRRSFLAGNAYAAYVFGGIPTHHMQGRSPVVITNIEVNSSQMPSSQSINLIVSGKGAYFKGRIHGGGP